MTRAAALGVASGLVVVALVGACSPSTAKERADSLGPEVEEPGPRHRPGQPCLWCHSTSQGDGRGEALFDLAGTVYRGRGDEVGEANLEITIENADGRELVVTSNLVGNFALVAEAGLTSPIESDEGIWRVPGPLVFPLHASVRDGSRVRHMRNAIQRERSCAVCHSDPPGAASNGRIHTESPFDAGPPVEADAG